MSLQSTQVSIPKVQTQDRNVNQLQSNIIDGIQRIQSNTMKLATLIGESRTAYLTVDQFTKQSGPGWVSQDGSSCIGSAYESLTGHKNVPNTTPPIGAILMIRIN